MNPPILEIVVAWGEMDALGHVNNTAFFRYMESARVAFLLWLGVDRLKMENGPGVILQSAQCRFRRPVVFPDTLIVNCRVTAIEADRFTLEHEMTSKTSGQVVAVGHGVIVAYDYAKAAKTGLPQPWELALRRVMAGE